MCPSNITICMIIHTYTQNAFPCWEFHTVTHLECPLIHKCTSHIQPAPTIWLFSLPISTCSSQNFRARMTCAVTVVLNRGSTSIHSIHCHVQNAMIPCRSQELLPFLSVVYPYLPPSHPPYFILPSISWSTSQPFCFQIHIYFVPFSVHSTSTQNVLFFFSCPGTTAQFTLLQPQLRCSHAGNKVWDRTLLSLLQGSDYHSHHPTLNLEHQGGSLSGNLSGCNTSKLLLATSSSISLMHISNCRLHHTGPRGATTLICSGSK
jgi:hypothetical protein